LQNALASQARASDAMIEAIAAEAKSAFDARRITRMIGRRMMSEVGIAAAAGGLLLAAGRIEALQLPQLLQRQAMPWSPIEPVTSTPFDGRKRFDGRQRRRTAAAVGARVGRERRDRRLHRAVDCRAFAGVDEHRG
jgi:hypothetical protein